MVIEKLDLAKSDLAYYKASKKPEIKDLDRYYYLSVEGQSSPEDEKFTTAIETIYPVAYAIKFLLKAQDLDFVVPKMECFWFVEGGAENQKEFASTPRDKWCWKIVIRMPDSVEQDHYFRAIENLKTKKPGLATDKIKFELIDEGQCAQILHIGSYENEGSTIEKLHNHIWENGYQINGYHKEIYLSDPRKTAEEKLRTIIRYSVK